MKKKCWDCKENKETSEFNKNTRRKDGLQSRCRKCQNERDKKLYAESKKRRRKVADRRRQQRERLRSLAHEMKRKGCAHCNEKDPVCMDFHHKTGEKETNLAEAIRKGWSTDRFLKEASKCSIICANCHRKIHFGVSSKGKTLGSGPRNQSSNLCTPANQPFGA